MAFQKLEDLLTYSGSQDDLALKYLLSQMQRDRGNPVSIFNKALAGFLAGSQMKKGAKRNSEIYKAVTTITGDKNLSAEDKATKLMELRPKIRAAYGKEMDSFVGGMIDDFWKMREKTQPFAKELRSMQTQAAKEGWQLNIDPNLPPQQQLEKARQLFAAKQGIKKPKPTWRQKQKFAAVKAGLQRGEVVIGREFGEPSVYNIKTAADAHRAIADAGFDPAEFTEELKRFEEVVVQDQNGELYQLPRYQLEEALKQGYTLVNG